MKSTFFDEIMKNVNRSGNTGDIVHTDSNPDYIPNYTHNFAYNLSSGAENIYIDITAFDHTTHNTEAVGTICIKNYTGQVDKFVMETLTAIQAAINAYIDNSYNVFIKAFEYLKEA